MLDSGFDWLTISKDAYTIVKNVKNLKKWEERLVEEMRRHNNLWIFKIFFMSRALILWDFFFFNSVSFSYILLVVNYLSSWLEAKIENIFGLSLRGGELIFTKFLILESKKNIWNQMKAFTNLYDQWYNVQSIKWINSGTNKLIYFLTELRKIRVSYNDTEEALYNQGTMIEMSSIQYK